MIKETPCRYCEDRKQNCHAFCKIYKDWKVEDDKRKAEYEKKRNAESCLASYVQDQKSNMMHRRKIKKDRL